MPGPKCRFQLQKKNGEPAFCGVVPPNSAMMKLLLVDKSRFVEPENSKPAG
jgi:hypothetical protein